MKINKRVFNYIDYELCNYESYKTKIDEIRKDILEESPHPPDGQPRGTTASDITLDKVIKMNTPAALVRMEYTVGCINKILKKLDSEYNKFFKENYEVEKPNNKMRVCSEVHISESTYYRMKRNIIKLVAREMGMI